MLYFPSQQHNHLPLPTTCLSHRHTFLFLPAYKSCVILDLCTLESAVVKKEISNSPAQFHFFRLNFIFTNFSFWYVQKNCSRLVRVPSYNNTLFHVILHQNVCLYLFCIVSIYYCILQDETYWRVARCQSSVQIIFLLQEFNPQIRIPLESLPLYLVVVFLSILVTILLCFNLIPTQF